jgi:hypothetical protein
MAGGRVLLDICFHSGLLFEVFFDPENRGDVFHHNTGLVCNRLHSVISQKTELFSTGRD